MSWHVDIIWSDTATGMHRCVAIAHLTDHGVKIEPLVDAFRPVVPDRVWDPAARVDVSTTDNPRRYLELLQHELRGSAVFASAPHDEHDECAFRELNAKSFEQHQVV
jgi:hypothetical protein